MALAFTGVLAWGAESVSVAKHANVRHAQVSTGHGSARDAQQQLGRQIYDGSLPGFGHHLQGAHDGRVRLPATQAACESCHRPSGLGSFEGGVTVPPIAGDFLFRPFDGATTRRYPWISTLRLRPAYTEDSLRELLQSGQTPDGLRISDVMPRYTLSIDEVAALSTHLRALNNAASPGVDDKVVHFATVTTPEVPAHQVNELLSTLNRFFVRKNANTRGESARRDSAMRNEQTMYRRHRRWELHHWSLNGEPATWTAQLQALYAREPVFAVLSGVGHQSWQPVHDFCKATRLPCLLPTAALPPQDQDFYSVYFSRGIAGQAAAAANALSLQVPRPQDVQVLAGTSAPERAQAQVISQILAQQGLSPRTGSTWHPGTPLISALPVASILERRIGPVDTQPVFVLAGMQAVSDDASLTTVSSDTRWVTDQLSGSKADLQLVRARAWLSANGLRFGDDTIARNALMAATVAVESLVHVDDRFSREYCVEKLEHNLENMPALTAYPRLSIGPNQRFAAKATMLLPMMSSTALHAAQR